MEKLKIGVVGAGNISTSAHLPAYAVCGNAVPVAICDINVERAKNAAERFGIPAYYSSVEEMLDKADIDAVDICTWNNGHAPVAVAAANAGKHVLCEKPLSSDMAGAYAIKEAVEKAGVKFHLAVPSRFGYANMYIRGLYEAGEFGEVYYAKTANLRRRGTPTGWFTDKKTSGGGPIIDIGIHCIDAAWYLMGNPKPTRVSANVFYKIGDYRTKGVGRWQGTPCPDNRFDCEDSGAGVIHFENGAVLAFETSWAINGAEHGETRIYGTKAGASVDPLVIYGERAGYLSTDSIKVHSANEKVRLEIEHFADCVLNDKPTNYPITQAVEMQRMLDAIYESGEKGCEIIL